MEIQLSRYTLVTLAFLMNRPRGCRLTHAAREHHFGDGLLDHAHVGEQILRGQIITNNTHVDVERLTELDHQLNDSLDFVLHFLELGLQLFDRVLCRFLLLSKFKHFGLLGGSKLRRGFRSLNVFLVKSYLINLGLKFKQLHFCVFHLGLELAHSFEQIEVVLFLKDEFLGKLHRALVLFTHGALHLLKIGSLHF